MPRIKHGDKDVHAAVTAPVLSVLLTTTMALRPAKPNLLIEGADLFVQEGEAWYTVASARNWNLRSPLYS